MKGNKEIDLSMSLSVSLGWKGNVERDVIEFYDI